MSTTDQFLELHKLLDLPAIAIAMAASLVIKVAQSASTRPARDPDGAWPRFRYADALPEVEPGSVRGTRQRADPRSAESNPERDSLPSISTAGACREHRRFSIAAESGSEGKAEPRPGAPGSILDRDRGSAPRRARPQAGCVFIADLFCPCLPVGLRLRCHSRGLTHGGIVVILSGFASRVGDEFQPHGSAAATAFSTSRTIPIGSARRCSCMSISASMRCWRRSRSSCRSGVLASRSRRIGPAVIGIGLRGAGGPEHLGALPALSLPAGDRRPASVSGRAPSCWPDCVAVLAGPPLIINTDAGLRSVSRRCWKTRGGWA